MLHRQRADVEEALGAVRHAALLRLVELAVPDRSRDALLKADVRQGVDGYNNRELALVGAQLFLRIEPGGLR